MVRRVDTRGHKPFVEYRPSCGLYFVVFEDLGLELAPAFSHKYTAREVAINSFFGVPFFTMIPTVPYGTEYPRPRIIMPRISDLDVELRIKQG